MRLAALSYGYDVVPDAISGAVAGVFPSACVIALDDGKLVTLVTAASGNLPGGIVIDAPKGFDFAGIAGDSAAVVRGGVLRFAGSDLTVDIRLARHWRSDLGALNLDLTRAESRLAWQATADLLLADGRAASFAQIAHTPIDALPAATTALDLDAARTAIAHLIGLGEGTTPAGDDFLVGFLGGLWASTGAHQERRDFAAELGRSIVAASGRTHRASRTYLAAAAVGEVSERLTRLVAALAAGSTTTTERTARAAIDVGHSSGACGVLGLLLGTSIWNAPDLIPALAHKKTATPEPIPPVPA